MEESNRLNYKRMRPKGFEAHAFFPFRHYRVIVVMRKSALDAHSIWSGCIPTCPHPFVQWELPWETTALLPSRSMQEKCAQKNWCSQASFVVSILCEVGLNKEGEKKVAGATRKLVCVSPSLVGSRQLEDRRRELGGKELEIAMLRQASLPVYDWNLLNDKWNEKCKELRMI